MHPHRTLFCTFLLSCSSSGDVATIVGADGAAFTQAIASVQADPGQAQQICAVLTDLPLQGECLAAGAEALAKEQPALAESLCQAVRAELERDECYFQLAERSHQRKICGHAGRFEEDCRMHFWSQQLPKELPPNARPGNAEVLVETLAAQHGFEAEDPRPWVALYRQLMGRMRPLSRESCGLIEDPQREAICRSTGMTLFHDRLNYLRDTAGYPCGDEALPSSLHILLDDELDAALQQRLQEDLCR